MRKEQSIARVQGQVVAICYGTKDEVCKVVVRSILLYGCETWPVQVAMLTILDNDIIRCILQVRRRDCVPNVRPAAPPPHKKHLSVARPKEALLVWSRCETS